MGRASPPLPLEDELFELRVQRVVEEIQHGPRAPWTGEVIRPPDCRQQSVVEIFRCPNEACRHWLKKPTLEQPSRCRVCSETATYLDLLASEALDEERRGRG